MHCNDTLKLETLSVVIEIHLSVNNKMHNICNAYNDKVRLLEIRQTESE